MKKSLVLLLVASFVLSLAGTALAFPVDFNGDVRMQFRSFDENNGTVTSKYTGEQARIRLNFAGEVEKDVNVYGRFSARTYFGEKFNSANGMNGTYDQTAGTLDQYGVKIANNGWTYKLGRQAVNLGQGAIISTGYDAVGLDNKFDGIVASGKMGAADVNVIVGKTNDAFFSVPSTWFGFDVSGNVGETLVLGLSAASEKQMDPVAGNSRPAKRYYAFNATWNPSANLTFNGEYLTSSAKTTAANVANDHNKAYFLAGSYSWDKDSFSIQYQNVGYNSVDASNSGIGANLYPYKGSDISGNSSTIPRNRTNADTKYTAWTYSYNHQMTKAASFNVTYMVLKGDYSHSSDKELAAGFRWKF